jgi:hypothetical protein
VASTLHQSQTQVQGVDTVQTNVETLKRTPPQTPVVKVHWKRETNAHLSVLFPPFDRSMARPTPMEAAATGRASHSSSSRLNLTCLGLETYETTKHTHNKCSYSSVR